MRKWPTFIEAAICFILLSGLAVAKDVTVHLQHSDDGTETYVWNFRITSDAPPQRISVSADTSLISASFAISELTAPSSQDRIIASAPTLKIAIFYCGEEVYKTETPLSSWEQLPVQLLLTKCNSNDPAMRFLGLLTWNDLIELPPATISIDWQQVYSVLDQIFETKKALSPSSVTEVCRRAVDDKSIRIVLVQGQPEGQSKMIRFLSNLVEQRLLLTEPSFTPNGEARVRYTLIDRGSVKKETEEISIATKMRVQHEAVGTSIYSLP